MNKAFLYLEDGLTYEGEFVYPCEEVIAELVFNTAMQGYQEVISDPSYRGQIVLFTYPQIGIYGLNDNDWESSQIQATAILASEFINLPQRETGLIDYLNFKSIPIAESFDTRSICKVLRSRGTSIAILSGKSYNNKELELKFKNYKQQSNSINFLKEVQSSFEFKSIKSEISKPKLKTIKLGIWDFGVKSSIIQELKKLNDKFEIDIVQIPGTYSPSAKEMDELCLDALLITNGPGDPRDFSLQIEALKSWKNKQAILGICLGHQLLSLAYGATIMPLLFGHHGVNHPILIEQSGQMGLSSQNHQYAVLESSLINLDLLISHRNLIDSTISGVSNEKRLHFGIQFHPEAGPGPNDFKSIFASFVEKVESRKLVEEELNA